MRRGTDTDSTITHTRGGSAANVAVAAAESGAMVRFLGHVGEDARGDVLIESLTSHGIDSRVTKGGSTGTVVVLVHPDGERSFLTDRGSATDLVLADVSALDDVRWLHVPGYSFAEGHTAMSCHRLVGEAVERSIPISVSTSSIRSLEEYGQPEFLDLIEAISPTLLVANLEEAMFLVGEELSFPNTAWSVITRGSGPTTITHSSGESRSVSPPHLEAADTTGAGDAFTGGLIAALLKGRKPLAAVRDGHSLAARAVQATGAQLAPADTEAAP